MVPEMTTNTCETCAHQIDDNCYRYPPTVFVSGGATRLCRPEVGAQLHRQAQDGSIDDGQYEYSLACGEYVRIKKIEAFPMEAKEPTPPAKKKLIISAFPGTGKTYFAKAHPDLCADSDSSLFSKDPSFPANYIEHIKACEKRVIFVSSHKVVRDALVAAGLPFTLVYPTYDSQDDYLGRYKQRGSPQAFIDLIDKNWKAWLDDCNLQDGDGCTHRMLCKGGSISTCWDKISGPTDLFSELNQRDKKDLIEKLCEAIKYLRAAKHKFAPNTTNSDVDYFLSMFKGELP